MYPNIYKYNHPVHGNICVKRVGNTCSFFSFKQKQTYGNSFTFKNKEHLISQINNNFHYHDNDFTHKEFMKYVVIKGEFDEFVKKRKTEESHEPHEPSLIEKLGIAELKSLMENMSKEDFYNLVTTNKELFEKYYELNKDRMYIKYSLFLNKKASSYMKKGNVEKLFLDWGGSENDFSLDAFKKLKTLRIGYYELQTLHSKLHDIGYTETIYETDEETEKQYMYKIYHGIRMEVPFYYGFFDLAYLPKYTNSLLIENDDPGVGAMQFLGTIESEILRDFKCDVTIVGRLNYFNFSLEKIELYGKEGFEPIILEDNVKEIIFHDKVSSKLITYPTHRYTGNEMHYLPRDLVKLTIGSGFYSGITPIPHTLTHLRIIKDKPDPLNRNPREAFWNLFSTKNIEKIFSHLPPNIEEFELIVDAPLKGVLTTLPKWLKKLVIRTGTPLLSVKDIDWPDNLVELEFNVSDNEPTIKKWPHLLRKLTLSGKRFIVGRDEPSSDVNVIVTNLPNSLKEFELLEPNVGGINLTNFELPTSLERFTAKGATIYFAGHLPRSIKYLNVKGVSDTVLKHTELSFPRGLEEIVYQGVRAYAHLPSSLKRVTLIYDPEFKKDILLNTLPPNLEEFYFDPDIREFKVIYTQENEKNIRIVTFINQWSRFLGNPGVNFRLPLNVTELRLENINGTFYGLAFLTNEYQNLSTIHVYDIKRGTQVESSTKLTILANNRVFIPIGTLTGLPKNLKDTITHIVFEEGYSGPRYFLPPRDLKYAKLPHRSQFYKEWDRKDIEIEFDEESDDDDDDE